MRFATAAAMLALVAAPVAAQTTRSISASDKAQGAQANPELVKQYGGRYTGPQAAFVERVGKRVAVQSGLSNAQGDFTVTTLNSPVENAFAIPGGYIYVTRQLLALMNSEAELASVLGHEVGHVAARHSQSRNTRSTIGSILAAGAGLLTGSNIATQLVGTGVQLYTLKYGRDQEYQADGLGIRYMTAAGYDPYASADMLASLRRRATSPRARPARMPTPSPPGLRPIPTAPTACAAPPRSRNRPAARKRRHRRTRRSCACSTACLTATIPRKAWSTARPSATPA